MSLSPSPCTPLFGALTGVCHHFHPTYNRMRSLMRLLTFSRPVHAASGAAKQLTEWAPHSVNTLGRSKAPKFSPRRFLAVSNSLTGTCLCFSVSYLSLSAAVARQLRCYQGPLHLLLQRHSALACAAVAEVGGAEGAVCLQGEEFTFRVGIDDTPIGKEKVRLDAFLCTQLPDASRAKLQASIKDGLVSINGSLVKKTSHAVKVGDVIACRLPPPRQLDAAPEAIPLDILYEDEHLLVVNKAAGMVVHPSPGHHTGTLVNALLHHCHLPAMQLAIGSPPPTSLSGAPADPHAEELPEDDDDEVEQISLGQLIPLQGGQMPIIRPGIVHRLDKGTSGLLVIAKDDFTHARLCEQFKEHSVERAYLSLTIGVPKREQGTIETNIGRDVKDRKKMAPFGAHSNRGRHAVSEYQVLGTLAGGRVALVEWRLRTGRTHQIRVHAKHAGHSILGDETYSGGVSTAINFVGGKSTPKQQAVRKIVKSLSRPALHAKTLGFLHPAKQEQLRFTSELPDDFASALDQLRALQ